MTRKPSKTDRSKYSYSQYAFRATEEQIEDIKVELEALYDKFNKGRDPKNPQGRKAVKLNDIALEALRIGISTLHKRSKWEF